MSVSVTVPLEQMKVIREKWPQYLDDYSRQVAYGVQRKLPGLLRSSMGRWQTGRLSASGKVYISLQGVEVIIGDGVPYTQHVFGGAGSHIIVPRRAKALRLHDGSFRKKVKHPGQRARSDIIQEVKDLVLQEAEDAAVVFTLMGVA